jgi:predicted dehydrogenase
VIIATPTHLHVPIALDCIAKGIAVFIEKPLSTTAEQARPLIEALRKSPVKTMVGYMNRHADTFRTAYQIIRNGALGDLHSFKGTMYISQILQGQGGKGWRYEKGKAGGGVLITQNSHLLDMLIWMFGDVSWVSGHTKTYYSQNVEDAVHCYLEFKSGLSGWIDTSWSQRHHRTLTTAIEVQGEHGTLHFDDDEVRLFLDRPVGDYPAGWTQLRKPDLFQGVSFDVAGPSYTRQFEEFVAAVRGQGKIESDAESAYRVQQVIDGIYRSAENSGARTTIDT